MAQVDEMLAAADKALRTLEEALAGDLSDPIVRDSAILRFTYSVDVTWKTASAWLESAVGEKARGPKPVLRACLAAGLLDAEETERALEAVDARNLTVHAYRESMAKELASRLPAYAQLLSTLLARIRARLPEAS